VPFAMRVAESPALLSSFIFTHNSAVPSMTRYQGRSKIHQGMPADEQGSKWSKMALTVVAVGGKCRGAGPIVYVRKRRCYHIDFFVDLMALSLVLCKINKLDVCGPPPVPRYTVPRGCLPRRGYWSQEATLNVFSQPLQSSRVL
jgi:hypothetical protein